MWHSSTPLKTRQHFDGLVQDNRNSSATAIELRLSCTNPSICLLLLALWLLQSISFYYGVKAKILEILVLYHSGLKLTVPLLVPSDTPVVGH